MRFKKSILHSIFQYLSQDRSFSNKFKKGMLYVFFICFISVSLIINELAWPNTFFKNYSVFEFLLNVLWDWLGKYKVGVMIVLMYDLVYIKLMSWPNTLYIPYFKVLKSKFSLQNSMIHLRILIFRTL